MVNVVTMMQQPKQQRQKPLLLSAGRLLVATFLGWTIILAQTSPCQARYLDIVPLSITFPPRGGSSSLPPSFPEDPYEHETVQERVDAWRRMQQEAYTHQSQEMAASPRDAQGRMKLLTSVSKGSRALIFFILMWRDVHLYEVADQTWKGLGRLLMVIPLMGLFLGNLAGAVASITSPSHSAKKRLKAILNLDKLVEVLLILHNFVRLTIFPSKFTPREIYIANTLHSVFFLLQSQAFTRLTWDEFTETTANRGVTSSTIASRNSPESPPASGVNPYSAYYGATDYASRDDGQEMSQFDYGTQEDGNSMY